MRDFGRGPSRARLRSFRGCPTCRRRKVKCDEIRPACSQCCRAGIICGGYEVKIRFVHFTPDGSTLSDDTGQAEGGHVRRLLLTEVEQESMSRQMQELVQEHELDQVLNDLDTDCELQIDGLYERGPFVLFQVNNNNDSFDVPVSLLLPHASPVDTYLGYDSNSPAIDSTAISTADVLMSMEDILVDVNSLSGLSSGLNLTHEPVNASFITSSSPVNNLRPASPSRFDFRVGFDHDGEMAASVLTKARFLLDHYKSQMGKLFSPLRVQKSPWSILHFPSALSAFSELSIFKKTTHAKASLFYSILAVSAFNWDKLDVEQKENTTYWWMTGEHFKCLAEKELKWACESDYYLCRDLDASCGGDFEYGLFGEPMHRESDSSCELFRYIYGFPQQLLSFISRTTCLANEIKLLKDRDEQVTAELQSHCEELENEICDWKNDEEDVNSNMDIEDSISTSARRAIMCHLVTAMHSAVIIFFYRRVRGLHPLLLQSYAEKTITSLELFEEEMHNFCLVNCGIVWPGFVAAAEALERDLQGRFHRLLRNCAKTSGMRNFDVAAEFLQDLWSQRACSDSKMTWMELVANRQVTLVMT
ncbi:hypothetical protein UA08_00884 [Talaromyces atroroseus]|uniref:Zn(2)-C6 fungal-type domain-containing protein n=1 Tax=Talaromyces atroroseus TaxID=1441469 RepID=A0A225AQJ5_TALAT|nr:hypothetical protein UA08_00884 [Talaromyces atroroseus]OKL63891.1 hypothetical protein UA08_00884 [Talaromyces atroroseus]